MCTKGGVVYAIRRRGRYCLAVGERAEGLAKMMAATMTVFEAASRVHGIRDEERHHVVADTGPDAPYFAARHRAKQQGRDLTDDACTWEALSTNALT